MTKDKKESSQLTIFEWVKLLEQSAPAAGSMDFFREFKLAMTEDLRHARDEHGRELSRYDVAARMSDLLGEEVTKSAIDNWTAPSHPHLIPVIHLPAFVLATGGRRAFEVLSRRSGLFALPGVEALRADIQRHEETIRKEKSEKLKKMIFLKEIEKEG